MVKDVGTLAMAYGLVRQSFADLAQDSNYGDGRFGEGAYGGTPPRGALLLVRVALWCRLLPRDRTLTATDQRWNGLVAVAGALAYLAAFLVSVVVGLVTI